MKAHGSTLESRRGATVERTVLYEDGSRARGVYVHLYFSGDTHGLLAGEEDLAFARTDEFGRFSFEDLMVGSYFMLANHDQFAPDSESDADGAVSFLIEQLGDTTRVDVVLKGEAGSERIEGRVVDDSGTAVEGASVVAEREGGVAGDCVTDERGWFHIDDLKVGAYTLTPSKTSAMRGTGRDVDTGSGPVTLVLPRTASVSGRVISSEGTIPEEFVVVACKPGERWYGRDLLAGNKVMSGEEWRPNSQESGEFLIEGIQRRRIKLVVVAAGYALMESTPVECVPGEMVEGIRLVVTHGAMIQGEVVAGGSGIEGARLKLFRLQGNHFLDEFFLHSDLLNPGAPTAISEEQGEFSFDSVPRGEYSVLASHVNWGTSEASRVTVSGDETIHLTIILEANGAIEGRVFDSESNEQCDGVTVIVTGPGKPRVLETGSDGSFQARELTPGKYLVLVSEDDHEHRSRFVDVQPGETTRIDMVRGAGQRVYGTVFLSDNAQSLAGLTVAIRRQSDSKLVGLEDPDPFGVVYKSIIASVFVDAEGRFDLSDIPSGTHFLQLERVPEVQDDASWRRAVENPLYRRKVSVGHESLRHDVQIEE